MSESSSLATAMNIFTAPRQAFATLKDRPSVWLPLLVLIVGYAVVSFTYMNSVDLGWFLDNQLAQNPAMTETQREQAVAQALKLSPMVYGAIGAITTPLFILIIISCVALYYTVVSFASNDGVKLKQWFALCCWSMLPALLGIVASFVNMSVNDARFMIQDAINPLALGNLLSIERTAATPLVQRYLLGIDPSLIWTMALSVIGYQMWTKSSLAKSVIVVLAPLTVAVLIGTLITLR